MAYPPVPTFIRTRSRVFVDPADYGLIADGSSHALSVRYATLAEAQADYPFAVSLGQEIDYCAVQHASNVAFGAAGAENGDNAHLNRRLHLPAGRYRFGNDTWTIRNLASGVIEGDGRGATALTSNEAVLMVDGIWYAEIANIAFLKLTDSIKNGQGAVELDGNIPGHAYATRGVQGVTLRNVSITGGGAPHALSMCRQGGGAGQGSECSFLNVHLQQASFACYYQNGFNALSNTFFGGNIQWYDKHGIYVVGGSIAIFNTGFQSTTGYRQIENDGWDIYVGEAGVYNGVPVYGCRTESLRFLKNAGAVSVDIRACSQNASLGGWFANTAYGAASPQYKAIADGARLFVATREGITSPSKPNFAAVATNGTVADNTIVWTETPFFLIDNLAGSLDSRSMQLSVGKLSAPPAGHLVTVTSDLVVTYEDIVIADATAGPLTVTLPAVTGIDRGRDITVKKSDTSSNAVTIACTGGVEGGEVALTIAGGSRGYRTLTWADGTSGTRQWLVIGSG